MNKELINPVTEIPVIPLAGKIAYPDMTINLLLARKSEIRAFDEVYKSGGTVLLVPQKDPGEENPDNTGFYKVGTLCRINQFARKSENRLRVLFTGISKVDVNVFFPDETGRQLEICSSLLFLQPSFPDRDLFVVGIAKDHEDALELVEKIVEEVYNETKGTDVRSYILNREQEE